jgi:hypothetical protein
MKMSHHTVYCKENPKMDLASYFQTLIYVLMGSVFIVIVLILLYAYYGKDEEETE